METHTSWKKTEEKEIDLLDLLYSLCMQWKWVLICALAGAVVLGAYSYMRNKSSMPVLQEGSAEETGLTREQQLDVEAAQNLKSEIRDIEEYLDSSVFMQIDPYRRNKAVLLYSVDKTESRDLQKIVESYLNFITNGGAVRSLKKTGNWDMEESCLGELITAYQKTYSFPYQIMVNEGEENGMFTAALFYVELLGKDSKMAKQLSLDVQSAMEEMQPFVRNTAGSHRLTLLSSEISVEADSDLQAKQNDKRTLLQTNLAGLETMTDAFTEEQMKAYRAGVGAEDSQEQQEETAAVQSGPSISKKYVLLGFAGGIFAYCFVFAGLYILRDTVKSAEEMRTLYTFPVYGSISSCKKARLGKKKGRKRSGHEEAQILNRVRIACSRNGITKICLASDFSFDGQEKECMERMAEQLKGFGIEASVNQNAFENTDLWDEMGKMGNVLMVCRKGTTTHRMIEEEMFFYTENGIAVTGAVVFSGN